MSPPSNCTCYWRNENGVWRKVNDDPTCPAHHPPPKKGK